MFKKKTKRFGVQCNGQDNERKVRQTLAACGLKVDTAMFDIYSDVRTLFGNWTPKYENSLEYIELSLCSKVWVS